MVLKAVLSRIRLVRIRKTSVPVEETTAQEIAKQVNPPAQIQRVNDLMAEPKAGILRLAVADRDLRDKLTNENILLPSDREWVLFDAAEDGGFWLISSKPCFLYTAYAYIWERLLECDVASFHPWLRTMSFSAEKSTFDLFLTQYARLIRGFDPTRYIKEYARLGFTHIEVNALAFPHPAEEGKEGEFYPEFYTYCPGLDQFITTRLNEGIYPDDYLKANLSLLKHYAEISVKYGLTPGLLCFEPRSVPEELFDRYPTLRGPRVDHPFRSFKPRFSLSLAHPVVQKHYAELITKLLQEVPELGFISIWSNDSGAGFEHTKSLYAGRNGGAYLIREWKDDEAIARAAADNIARFLELLRDAASIINPEFRVLTRLESFYGERRYLWPRLRERIGTESHSLLTAGWESNYPHPEYPDIQVVGSALQNGLREDERKPLKELESRGGFCFFYHAFASHTNHEPLLGIPFPWLTFEKLECCRRLGIRTLAHLGGIHPPDKVPYAVNQEIFRLFQFDPALDINQAVREIAVRYAGEAAAGSLVDGWRKVDLAVRSFPPLSIYTNYGAVWQRLLVRPLVPDIEAIPEEERQYYENMMCTSVHNPNRVDLAQDVLFELVSKEYARTSVERIDENVWEHLESAISQFEGEKEKAKAQGDESTWQVFNDQSVRIKALRCLMETLRNTAVWIFAVHEYLESADPAVHSQCRAMLEEMINREIKNCHQLITLWNASGVEWMIVSAGEETPFIYGRNFAALLEEKISLMEKYRSCAPFIDPDYMYRVGNNHSI